MKVLALLILTASHWLAAAVVVHYTVEPRAKARVIAVTMRLEGLETGKNLEMQISKEFGSANDFYNDIENLEVSYPKDISLKNSTQNENIIPYQWVTNKPLSESRFELKYEIKTHQNLPGTVRFKPSLNEKNSYSNGYPLFLFPLQTTKATFYVKLDLPKGWQAILSLTPDGSGGWTTQDLDALLASTVAMGNYRKVSFVLPNGIPFTVATNGAWSFNDNEFSLAAHKIISAQIETMQSWHFPSYSVILTESTEKGSSGSGLVNAFEMFADKTVTLDDLYYVISHENFHYWNGNRIRYEAPRDRWFSEGFTDYYAYLMLGRMKIWPLKKVLKETSKAIQLYYDNPVSELVTFEEAGKHFWNWLLEYGKLSYSKGMLIALMADVRLRSASNNLLTLDGFMRHLDQKYFNSGNVVNDKSIQAELEAYSTLNWQGFINRFVLGKEKLPVNEYIPNGGMFLKAHTCKKTDLGFTPLPYFCPGEKPCGYRAEKVLVNGPAFKAGLREGDIISEWNPKFLQTLKANSIVKLGVQKGSSLVWHEYTTGETDSICHSLTFTPSPTPLEKKIRESIWKIN